MARRVILGLVVAAFLCTGCARRIGDLTLMSSRNVNLAGLAKPRTGNEPRISAYDVCHFVLIFPVTSEGNIKEALDKALDKGKGDAMVDAVIYSYWWYIPLIYGQSGWRVKGTVINSYGP